jgi:FAD/FMN-containing dehydrogenase
VNTDLGLDIGQRRATSAAASGLRPRLGGDVLLPGDDGYEDGRRVWNGMSDRRPAAIAFCESTDDVVAAIRFAAENALSVTVRGGGHHVAGTSVADGALVIDVSRMKDVAVDPVQRTATAGAGCTLGEVDAATQAHGLAVPLGVVSETGIAGLTLGGGVGWLRRKHGLASDNLVSIELVTADGSVLTASERENVDLFWALRGGGGGVGVVTRFVYRAHPVGPEVMVAFVLYPADRAVGVFRSVDEYTKAAGDEVSPVAFLGYVPPVEPFPEKAHGAPYVAILVVHPGSVDDGMAALEPLRALGDPIADLSGPIPYVDAQKLLDEDYPNGWHYYWKSVDLEELGHEALERIVSHAAVSPSHHSTIDVWFHGGAMSRVDPDATAFGARPAYLIGVEANWEEDNATVDAANVAWARETVADLQRFSSGGAYLNFPGLYEEGEALLRASYGDRGYERLVAVKKAFDPSGLFAGPR